MIGTGLFTVRETEGLRREKKRKWMEMIDLLKWKKKNNKRSIWDRNNKKNRIEQK